MSKLLLIAQLWGIRVEARQEDARAAELKWALLRPWQWAAGLYAVLFLGAAVVGLFSDYSVVDKIADFADFLRRWGFWQWTLAICAIICARRLWHWVFAYSAMDLADTLHPCQDAPHPQSKSAGVSTV